MQQSICSRQQASRCKGSFHRITGAQDHILLARNGGLMVMVVLSIGKFQRSFNQSRICAFSRKNYDLETTLPSQLSKVLRKSRISLSWLSAKLPPFAGLILSRMILLLLFPFQVRIFVVSSKLDLVEMTYILTRCSQALHPETLTQYPKSAVSLIKIYHRRAQSIS